MSTKKNIWLDTYFFLNNHQYYNQVVYNKKYIIIVFLVFFPRNKYDFKKLINTKKKNDKTWSIFKLIRKS